MSQDRKRILLVGASGRLGEAVHTALTGRGHDVVTVGRSSGDLRCDITDPAAISDLLERAGGLDAVACAAGEVPFKSVQELKADDYRSAFTGKVLAQIELVRQGINRIAPNGSFTLITGILARSPIVSGAAAAMANGAVEAFVRSAAIEIAPQRINAVSPSVVTESLADYGDFFPGFPSVDLKHVALAYIRSIDGAQTGQIYELGQ